MGAAVMPGGPGCSTPTPLAPPGALAPPGSIYSDSNVPLQVRFSVDESGNVVQPNGSALPTILGSSVRVETTGVFTVFGLRSFTGPGIADLTSIKSGDLQLDQLPGPVDVAFYNTDDCFCPIDPVCITQISPLVISAKSLISGPADVCLVFVGCWQRGINTCFPTAVYWQFPGMSPGGYGFTPAGFAPGGQYGNGQYGGGNGG